MSEEIRPALTAEEWVEVHSSGIRLATSMHVRAGADGIEMSDKAFGAQPVSWSAWFGDDRRKLAAVVLNGHPAGFTWEDVDLLRRAAAEAGVGIEDEEARSEQGRDYANLAGRIAALLPPRAL